MKFSTTEKKKFASSSFGDNAYFSESLLPLSLSFFSSYSLVGVLSLPLLSDRPNNNWLKVAKLSDVQAKLRVIVSNDHYTPHFI